MLLCPIKNKILESILNMTKVSTVCENKVVTVRHCTVSLGSSGMLRETNVKPSLHYLSLVKKERKRKKKRGRNKKLQLPNRQDSL